MTTDTLAGRNDQTSGLARMKQRLLIPGSAHYIGTLVKLSAVYMSCLPGSTLTDASELGFLDRKPLKD
jgi:hypothetical protein